MRFAAQEGFGGVDGNGIRNSVRLPMPSGPVTTRKEAFQPCQVCRKWRVFGQLS